MYRRTRWSRVVLCSLCIDLFTTRHKVVHNGRSTNFRRLSFDKKTNYLAQILQSLSSKVCSIILPKFNTSGLFIPILGTSAIMDQTACCHRVTTSETGLYFSYKMCSIKLPKFNVLGLFIPILGTSAIMDQIACCQRVTTSETGLYFSYKVSFIKLPKFNTFGLFIPILGTSAIMDQTACCYNVTASETGL